MSSSQGKYQFVLYIDSLNTKSSDISKTIRQLCQSHLSNPYTLEVVDLQDNPELLEEQRIIAVPTLDVTTPQMQRHRFIGDLSTTESFIIAIGMFQSADEMRQKADRMRREIHRLQTKPDE